MTQSNNILVVWHFRGDGENKDKPFKKCVKKHTCPSIREGPFDGDLLHSHAYYLLQLQFHWGSDNTKGSEHELNGKK